MTDLTDWFIGLNIFSDLERPGFMKIYKSDNTMIEIIIIQKQI